MNVPKYKDKDEILRVSYFDYREQLQRIKEMDERTEGNNDMKKIKDIAGRDTFIVSKPPSADDFIKQTEGNRPKVNDPRANKETKGELSKAELKAQEKATREWESKLNG